MDPLYIRMDERDNVAIVANDGGLPSGASFADGLTLVERVPQGHKVALVNLAAGDAVRRYNVVIGRAAKPIRKGSWVHERLLEMPAARSLEGLPIATVKRAPLEPLEGYQVEAESGESPIEILARLLRLPYTLSSGTYVWPFAYDKQEDELTDYERELLGDLAVYSGAGSGYLGWRAGIEPDGTWRFFIAGD